MLSSSCASLFKGLRYSTVTVWQGYIDDLKRNSQNAFDLWVLGGKPLAGCIFESMKNAKYKYKLAIRHVVKEYEDKFIDGLFDHLMSKGMARFWSTWSAKSS